MDVSDLHDEENLLVQMQDRWENYGSLFPDELIMNYWPDRFFDYLGIKR